MMYVQPLVNEAALSRRSMPYPDWSTLVFRVVVGIFSSLLDVEPLA